MLQTSRVAVIQAMEVGRSELYTLVLIHGAIENDKERIPSGPHDNILKVRMLSIPHNFWKQTGDRSQCCQNVNPHLLLTLELIEAFNTLNLMQDTQLVFTGTQLTDCILSTLC